MTHSLTLPVSSTSRRPGAIVVAKSIAPTLRSASFTQARAEGMAANEPRQRELAAARLPAAKPQDGLALAGQQGAAQMESLNATASVASVASAAKVGELFQYTVGNVTLPRQTSAMIPVSRYWIPP